MGLKALFYAYVLGGLTLVPLLVAAVIFISLYTAVPVGDLDPSKQVRAELGGAQETKEPEEVSEEPLEVHDAPQTRKGWLTMRRTFEESKDDGSYVGLVRSFIDARSKDPKRSRPKDFWYCVLKGKVLYLYEDESMTECEAVLELGGHDVLIYPEGLMDGELFAKRNGIMLRQKSPLDAPIPSVTREMNLPTGNVDAQLEGIAASEASFKKKTKDKDAVLEAEKARKAAKEEALNPKTPWFIFVRSAVEMEDWYLALLHASDHPANSATLSPLLPVYRPTDMAKLVATLDESVDTIPMRWLNALIGRLFFSFYRTHALEANIIARLMKKLSKVPRPAFLTDIVVTEVSVGNRPPTFSKPMLKELTREGDASFEVHMAYKGEFRITIEATATITLGSKYTVKLALAAVVRELEGNLLVKVKRPPSNRIWYAFTAPPKMVLDVEPIVSDRQITWTMILSTIESQMKAIILESVVMPNMDDISFFETAEFKHRGGIWGDAARKVKVPSETRVNSDGPSEGIPLARSQSAEATATPQVEELDNLTRAATTEARLTAGDVESTSPGPSAKRRTWFSSVRDDDTQLATPQSNISTMFEERGRTAATTETESTRTRSRSTSNQGGANRSATVETVSSEVLVQPDFLSPEGSASSTPQRSSSQPRRDRSPEPETALYTDVFRTPSRGSSHGRSNSQSKPVSPPGFLETLKSRAGDKQAINNINNTAKEAMRKWGVNWGAKKEVAASSDEMPDHGCVEPQSRVRADSTTSTSPNAQKPGKSYAEMRAAVQERKEVATGTAPVAIPIRNQSRRSSYSNTSQSGLLGASPASGTSTASSSKPVTAASSTSNRGLTPPPPSLPSQPIHTQPSQARTMMVPGIHASHRNEVQSLGFVAPKPAPPPTESILKTPAMNLNSPALQSVYRLWKSPGSTSKELPEATVISESVSQPPPLPPRQTTERSQTPRSASDVLQSIQKRSSVGSTPSGNSLAGPPLPPRPSA